MREIGTHDIIKMMLAASGMSQRELAHKAHLTEASVSRYVTGERDPRFQTMQDIILACGFKLIIEESDNG